MVRPLLVVTVVVLSLATVTAATGATFVRLTTTTVHRGRILRLAGNADHMPLYALPASRMPCARYGTCSAVPTKRAAPPRSPFVFLAYTPAAPNASLPTRAFSARLPRALRPGRYKIFVWCEPCGGSLIIAGRDTSGQTLRVVR